jgi:hypothetical protein
MCDYSLAEVRSRLAQEGEQLVVHRFITNSLGLASPAELPGCDPNRERPFLARLIAALCLDARKSPAAVCVPPGAKLFLRDIPEKLQNQYGVGREEEVTFVQLSADAFRYRDGVRFQNGREVLLQRLKEGQRVEILSMACEEEMPDAVAQDEQTESLGIHRFWR